MRRPAPACIIGLIIVPALAGPEILPVSGVDYLRYDVLTGKITPVNQRTPYGPAIWSYACDDIPYFWGADGAAGEMGLDWGDIAGPACVGGFGFAEFTNSQAADGDLYVIIAIYAEENGWDSAGRVCAAAYLIENVPASTHPPDEYWGHIWNVDVGTPFVLDGSDLDADGLVDWGYAQFFSVRTPGALHGPAVCDYCEPNELPATAPGIDHAFDMFVNPLWNNGPEYFDPNDIEPYYYATYWFGGCPFAQFYFELYAPSCPNEANLSPECAWFNVDCDCIVGLGDLATLLSNYGCTTGCTRWQGDFDPIFEGDGDVDLADLGALLRAYVTCKEP
jgi:hypothetical protein